MYLEGVKIDNVKLKFYIRSIGNFLYMMTYLQFKELEAKLETHRS